MAVIVASYSPLQQVKIQDGYAEYGFQRVSGGTSYVFLVEFVRDVDGVWRIESM
jgi:hypothetical protein